MQISLIYSFICSFLCICYNINLYIFTNHKAFSVKADAFHVRYFIDFSDKTAVAIKLIPAGDLPDSGQSGYSQSASLLAHNRVAASQLIRSGLYHSWYKQVPTHCLLLSAIEAGDLPDSVKKGSVSPGPNRRKNRSFVIILSNERSEADSRSYIRMYFKINSTASTAITGPTFFFFPVTRLITT